MRIFQKIECPHCLRKIPIKCITSSRLCSDCLFLREMQFTCFILYYNEIVELLQKDENIDQIIKKYDDLNGLVSGKLVHWLNCSNEPIFSLQEIQTFQKNLHTDISRYINIHIEELKHQLEDVKSHSEL